MNKPIAIALIVVGLVLIVVGASATQSFSSDVSKFFTGSPTNKAIWTLVGGTVIAAFGLFALRGGNKA
jgi:hypothetical protein